MWPMIMIWDLYTFLGVGNNYMLRVFYVYYLLLYTDDYALPYYNQYIDWKLLTIIEISC